MASSDRQKGFVSRPRLTPPRLGAAGQVPRELGFAAARKSDRRQASAAPDQFRHEKAAPPGGSAAMRFVRP